MAWRRWVRSRMQAWKWPSWGSRLALMLNKRRVLTISTPMPHWCSCHYHNDVIKWKHFPRYWTFVRGIHRSPVNSPHNGQWRGALMFSLICTWINAWVNNREAGDLRLHRAHYDVIVMMFGFHTRTCIINPSVATDMTLFCTSLAFSLYLAEEGPLLTHAFSIHQRNVDGKEME